MDIAPSAHQDAVCFRPCISGNRRSGVIGRADLAVILVPHGAAEAAAGYNSGYVACIGMRSRSIAWTGLHRGRYMLLLGSASV